MNTKLETGFITWLANKFGYRIVLIKVAKKEIIVKGNEDVIRFMDLTMKSGYFSKNNTELFKNKKTK
jgi:hypothetical protein